MPQLELTNAYSTMFASMFIIAYPGFWTARASSQTGMDQDMKIDNISTANSAITFVSLFKTHVLEQWHHPTPENVTI